MKWRPPHCKGETCVHPKYWLWARREWSTQYDRLTYFKFIAGLRLRNPVRGFDAEKSKKTINPELLPLVARIVRNDLKGIFELWSTICIWLHIIIYQCNMWFWEWAMRAEIHLAAVWDGGGRDCAAAWLADWWVKWGETNFLLLTDVNLISLRSISLAVLTCAFSGVVKLVINALAIL